MSILSNQTVFFVVYQRITYIDIIPNHPKIRHKNNAA